VKAALVHSLAEGLSDRQLAQHCGVTPPVVAAWREKLGLSIKNLEIGRPRKVTRKGTTYQQDTANIGRRASVPKQNAEPVPAQPPMVGLANDGPTDDSPHEAIEAMRKIVALGLTAGEFEAWLEQQPDQSELTQILEKLNALINQVLTLGKADAAHV
jgi:hypothetical protein